MERKYMSNVPTWISRVSAIALATASVSAFAAAPNAPDFIMHKANVNFKVSSQGVGEIEKETVKTKNVINLLMGRSIDAKNEKDETLGIITQCDENDEDDDSVMVVYDKKTEEIKDGSDSIIFYTDSEIVELDKNGDYKKSDGFASTHDEEAGFIDVTAQTTYGKIGSGCAKDGDTKDNWNKDSVCVKKVKSKSITGLGFFGDVVMSGKISAGSCQFAFDDPTPNPVMDINKSNDVEGELARPASADPADDASINYTIVVNNTGNVDLTGVVITDNQVDDGVLDCGAFGSSIDVNESATCTGTRTVTQEQFDIICSEVGDGSIQNIALVTSNEANDKATDNFVDLDCTTDPTLGLAINKTSNQDDAEVVADDVIAYTITVENLSGAAATNVTVTDTLVDLVCDPVDGSNLAIDEVMTCTGDYTVTANDVADACGVGGNETPSAPGLSRPTDCRRRPRPDRSIRCQQHPSMHR